MGSLYELALSNKGKWKALSELDSIQVGNTTIRKGIVEKINIPVNLATSFGNNLSSQVVKGDGTLTAIIDSTLKGRFGIDAGNSQSAQAIVSTISSFGGNLFTGQSEPDATPFNIGAALGISEGFGNVAGTVTSDLAKGIGNTLESPSKKISNFVAPISNTIDKLNSIGKEFDEIIKDTFLGRVFKIKGSEILCSMFCIVVSMLPCNTRQLLYEAVTEIKNSIKLSNSITQGANQLISSGGVEAPLLNERSIADNVKNLFSKNIGNNATKVFNIPAGTDTKKPSLTLDIPPTVATTISNLTLALSVIAKGQITLPVKSSGSIWDQSQVILNLIQSIVAQMADEFLNKVVKKVESQLKSMTPQICVGNMASIFINKIMVAIADIKNFYIEQLKGLFGDSKNFSVKWQKYGWHFKELQELLAMLNALSLVLKKFPDLALLCGIQPCKDPLPNSVQEDIQNAVRNGMLTKETNEPAGLLSIDQTPKGKTLEDISDIFKEKTLPGLHILPNETGFSIVMPQIYKDAPKQIQDIILSDEFRNELGSAYNIYSSPDIPFVNITYTYKLTCGDK